MMVDITLDKPFGRKLTTGFRTAVHPKHLASQVCPHVPRQTPNINTTLNPQITLEIGDGNFNHSEKTLNKSTQPFSSVLV